VISSNSKLLSKKKVSEFPYLYWSPYQLSHKLIGYCPADVTYDLQRAMTMTLRGMQDNIWMTNTTRTIGNLSLVRNPRDLLDNPIGGHIDAPTDSVVPFQTPQLNQSTFGLLENLQQAKESRTGVTRLAGGLNTDAISNQNADDMIERLMGASNERVLEMARSFAEQVFKPLLMDIYTIARDNGVIGYGAVDGAYTAIDPSQFEYRDDMIVSTALTPEEGLAEAQALLTLHGIIGQEEELASQYTAKEKTALFYSAMELMGITTPKVYLAAPNDPEVQQREEMDRQMGEQQRAFEQQMQEQQQKFLLAVEQIRNQPKIEQTQLDAIQGADEQALEEDKFRQDQYEFEVEAELERQQSRNVTV
jgi:hypothetical protein